MNILFSAIFLVCSAILLFIKPENFLPTLLDGASRAATLCVSLVANYSVWMGLMRVWEDSGVARGFSKLLKPLVKRLLKTDDETALRAICMNFSVNMLGISGAATPYGVNAAKLLDKTEHAEYSSAMFFVLNASSLQILPTSIIGVRVAMGSAAPMDVVIPTLLTSAFCTLLSVTLTALLFPRKTAKVPILFTKTMGAGTR